MARTVMLEMEQDGSKTAVVTNVDGNNTTIQRQPVTMAIVLSQRAGLEQQKQTLKAQIAALDLEMEIWRDIEAQLGG